MIKYIFEVEGMMCSNCEKHAVESVKKAISQAKITASHQDKKVEVISNNEIDESLVVSAIEGRGYTVKGVKKEEVKKKGLFSFFKK